MVFYLPNLPISCVQYFTLRLVQISPFIQCFILHIFPHTVYQSANCVPYLNVANCLFLSCPGQSSTSGALPGRQYVYKYTGHRATQCLAGDHHWEELKTKYFSTGNIHSNISNNTRIFLWSHIRKETLYCNIYYYCNKIQNSTHCNACCLDVASIQSYSTFSYYVY